MPAAVDPPASRGRDVARKPPRRGEAGARGRPRGVGGAHAPDTRQPWELGCPTASPLDEPPASEELGKGVDWVIVAGVTNRRSIDERELR